MTKERIASFKAYVELFDLTTEEKRYPHPAECMLKECLEEIERLQKMIEEGKL